MKTSVNTLTTSCRPGWCGSPAPGTRFRPASRALLPMSPRRVLAACVLLAQRVCGHQAPASPPGQAVTARGRDTCPSHGGGPSTGRVRATAASRVDTHLDLHLVTEEGGEAHIAVVAAPGGAVRVWKEQREAGRGPTAPAGGWPRRGTAWPRPPQLPCTPPPCSQTGGPAAHGLPRRPLWPVRPQAAAFRQGPDRQDAGSLCSSLAVRGLGTRVHTLARGSWPSVFLVACHFK